MRQRMEARIQEKEDLWWILNQRLVHMRNMYFLDENVCDV